VNGACGIEPQFEGSKPSVLAVELRPSKKRERQLR